MKFFKRLFQKEKPKEVPVMPPWPEIVEMMYDKYLDSFADKVVSVVYSIDKTMRYVVLKDEKGLFTYQLETIHQFDEDEWKYICSHNDALPAMWAPFRDFVGYSLFENEEELLKEMKEEPEYKQYFE
ncbi:MAG: hypothetical protein SOZ93_02230 [Eubacteriales bacterium]|nr:hypothetical protein [Eubacteriales bacterium]